MTTERITLDPQAPDPAQIKRAAASLAEGAIVAFPTETVYGVAANAAVGESVRRLRDLKGRATQQPFTVHIGRRSDCESFVPDMPPIGRRLVRKGWPGPMTLIFAVNDPGKAAIHNQLSPEGQEATYVSGSVGLRLPDDLVAAGVLAAAEAPIIASSANVTGEEPPTTADQVMASLEGRIDLLLDAGPTRYKKASTIVRLNGTGYHLVRAGVFDDRTIRRLATVTILFVCSGNTCRSPMAEGLFKRKVADKLGCDPSDLPASGIIIESAGTGGGGGRAADPAVDICRRHGIDISGHRSRGLTQELVQSADYIFAMEEHHLETVRGIWPGVGQRADLLTPGAGIADPVGGTIEDYEASAAAIEEGLTRRISEVDL